VKFVPNLLVPAALAEAAQAEDQERAAMETSAVGVSEAQGDTQGKAQPLLAKALPLVRFTPDLDWKPAALDLALHETQMQLEAGRRFHQAGLYARARMEFDAALDRLLGLRAQSPVEQARLQQLRESWVNRIYRYDLEAQEADEVEEDAGRGSGPRYERAPLEDILTTTFPVDPRLKLRLREELAMTASELPLQLADPVVSFIHYFGHTEAGRRKFLFGLRRQGRYRPMIQKVLAEEGVPQELIFLAQAESAFQPRAKSWAAAVGMWQFVRNTGLAYGLKQSALVDERMDPERATRSAARHLKDLYNRYGDWYLAIAAYNCGAGCVDAAVERTGYADFWELRARRAVPLETTNYVPIIVAFAFMSKNAERYGIAGVVEDDAADLDVVTLDAPTHLSLVQGVLDLEPGVLEEWNPSLLTAVAPAGFELKVPPGSGEALRAAFAEVPAAKRAAQRAYRMRAGETVAEVAARFHARVEAATVLRNGSLVLLPLPEPAMRKVWVKRGGKRVLVTVPAGAAKRPAVSTSKKAAGRPSGRLVAGKAKKPSR
jgi:membrane-bound lytic murein transglycosylase D